MIQQGFRFIDLFAGIGGFHHALSRLGGECVLTCEIDADCRTVYRHAFPNTDTGGHLLVSDIRQITRTRAADPDALCSREQIELGVPDHEVLCAGFPCQPFSKSGAQEGVRDTTRGTLFFDIMQIIDAKRPLFVVLENVRNLAGPRHTDTWDIIIRNLGEAGYDVAPEPLVFSPHLLPPDDGGAPQVRDRLFIVGVRSDIAADHVNRLREFNDQLRAQAFWDPDGWRIDDYLDDDSAIADAANYRVSANEEVYLEAWGAFVEDIEVDALPGFPIWADCFVEKPVLSATMAEWEREFRIKNSAFYVANRDFLDEWTRRAWGPRRERVGDFPQSRQKFECQARKRHPRRAGRTLKDLVVQFRPSGIRVKPATYLPALVAITQTSVIGPLLRPNATVFRKLTPVEASRLQGIPESVYRTGVVPDAIAYKQLGNAVNVGLAERIVGVVTGLRKQTTVPSAAVQGKQERRPGRGLVRGLPARSGAVAVPPSAQCVRALDRCFVRHPAPAGRDARGPTPPLRSSGRPTIFARYDNQD